jgi:hypothetical protein
VFFLIVLRIRDILVRIQMRGSVSLTYGSGFGSGSGLYRTGTILTLLSVEERCSNLIVLRIRDISTDPD